MKKNLLTLLLIIMSSQLFAHEMMEEEKESKYYTVVKALYTLGDTVQHGEATLVGKDGYGFGIDFGYRIANGFAFEYDFSYATNSVTENIEGELPRDADATYLTHAVDIVYGHEILTNLEFFAKVGYEYELEKISDFDIDNGSDGAVFGIGAEYEFTHNMKILGEYEHSTIDGPRGDSLNCGIMYNF